MLAVLKGVTAGADFGFAYVVQPAELGSSVRSQPGITTLGGPGGAEWCSFI